MPNFFPQLLRATCVACLTGPLAARADTTGCLPKEHYFPFFPVDRDLVGPGDHTSSEDKPGLA